MGVSGKSVEAERAASLSLTQEGEADILETERKVV